jgi:hypothetical protein
MTEQILNEKIFAVYGAQTVAYGAYAAIRALYNRVPACFVVSDMNGNASKIDGIDVRELAACRLPKSTLIVVAVSDLLQEEACVALKAKGYENIIKLDSHAEHLLMSAYYDSIGKFPAAMESPLPADLRIYVSHCKKDKILKNPPALLHYERDIQADELPGVPPNHMYSEMSAMHYLWKNTSHSWKGLCHYRRHLLISGVADADALLPLPYMCYPNTLAQFGRFVSRDVADALTESLKTLHPESFERCMEILNGKYQYTYNLLCAKEEVFDDYCEWAFGILRHMERTYADKIPTVTVTRDLSYAAEAVTNLYFMSGKLKIRHVEKRIYS